MFIKYIFIFHISIFFSITAFAQPTIPPLTVKYGTSLLLKNAQQSYYLDVLQLALEKSSDKYGAFKLQEQVLEMHQGRTLNMLEQGKVVDVVWSMTSKEREQRFNTVYIPILKGLMGYRIGIIRADDQYQFTDINSLSQLKQTSIGQGIDWPDTQILLSGGFNVIQGAARNLLPMLKMKRFDFFPRGLHEPWGEIKEDLNLKVESRLLLKYPAPIYFFVNKINGELSKRLEFGLKKAIKDGSFDKLFYNHEMIFNVIKKANLSQRRIFELHNPLLSDKTKELLSDDTLWLSPLNLTY
ncbi:MULTISPECIES: hypothetical protein [unclassified Pseudoalteromonas]|uniref:hypothetical protein n=1 Tax=unclassified Pseudoalteromonas TaxID=194690 RepID=UPI000693BB93|nr:MULTISPECIES: hypothetical protein [unclassified Pseudoalteromonas]